MKQFYQKAKLIGMAILALLVVVIVLQNTESVETKLLFLKIEMPRAALLFGTLIVGFGFGVLTAGRLITTRARRK
jgi:uncharacterized integral membrane protein